MSYALAVLKLDDETDRFLAKCASCMRGSPVVDGPLDAAKARMKELGWGEGVDGQWHCRICTTRSTSARKRFSAT